TRTRTASPTTSTSAVRVLEAVVGLGLGRALVDVVGDAVLVRVAHVRAAGSVEEIVGGLGHVGALVEVVGHAFVVAVGAAVILALGVADDVAAAGVGAHHLD